MFKRGITFVLAVVFAISVLGQGVFSVSETNKDRNNSFIVQFLQNAKTVEINDAVNRYKNRLLGPSEDKLFEIWDCERSAFSEKYSGIIDYTSPVTKRKLKRTPNDTYIADQYALNVMNIKSAWDVSVGSASVKIGVLDTGVDRSTVDMNSANILPGHDFNTGGVVTSDSSGHGTGVASIIAATANNKSYLAGVCWRVAVVPYKIYDENDETDTATEIKALKMALQDGCKVINLSFGGYDENEAEKRTLQELADKGVLIFAAAGNDGVLDYEYPASYSSVFSVAGCDSTGNKWSGSSFNNNVDISAPAKSVMIMIKGDSKFEIGYGTGTSFSTPYSASIVALACALAPDLNYKMLYAALPSVCRDRDNKGKDAYSGYGTLDARKLLDYANSNWTLNEPLTSASPQKVTVTSLSKPKPGASEYDPDITGNYFLSSMGAVDTDLEVFKAIFSGNTYTFDFNKPFASEPSTSPFFLKLKLEAGSKYLFDAYANDKQKGKNVSFLIFKPAEILGRKAITSSGNMSSKWGQELIYTAKYSGSKNVVLSSTVSGASGGFSVYKGATLLGKAVSANNAYSFDFDAVEGEQFSFVMNSNSNVSWTIKVKENDYTYNLRLKEFNIEGGRLDKPFDPNVFEYFITASSQRVSLYWLPYFSEVRTEISTKNMRAMNYFVAGGANKVIYLNVLDGKGGEKEYKFNLTADVAVVGTATPTPMPTPTPTPKPTMTPKPVISGLKYIKKNGEYYLSFSISWNKKGALKLSVLNSSDVPIKTLWKNSSNKVGSKVVYWNFKNEKKAIVKPGLYIVKFSVDNKFATKRFYKK
ncbi:MAG: S8 family serine peptidase [Bacillota bacterium]